MALSKDAQDLLISTHELGLVCLLAHHIVPCAELIQAGYVKAENDYAEGPWIALTTKGKKHLAPASTP